MREGTAPLSPVPLYFSSLYFTSQRSPLSERLEQAKLQWQLLKRDPRQMNMNPTQEMTFLIGRTKILRLLPFQDLGGQYVPIFDLICKVCL